MVKALTEKVSKNVETGSHRKGNSRLGIRTCCDNDPDQFTEPSLKTSHAT